MPKKNVEPTTDETPEVPTPLVSTDNNAKEELFMTASGIPVIQQLSILAAILLLIFGTGYIPEVLRSLEPPETTAQVPQATNEVVPEPAEEIIDPFFDVNIAAESAYVWDVSTQRSLYQKNPDEQLPLASITKLMTALVAYELLEDSESIPISLSAIRQDGYSGLSEGESFSLASLLSYMLMSSSNDGAFAIASAVGAELVETGDAATFVEAMNIRASELGLTQTYFRNPTGLDISESEGGAYGSARDVTFLMEYILSHHPAIIEETQTSATIIESETGLTHEVDNTNPTVDQIEGLIGSKTGYTELAGGNLVVAFDAAFNRPVIVVVLGSSRAGRFDDVLTLTDRARQAVQ